MIKRYFDDLGEHLQAGKVLIIYGPRRVGKTTLIENYLSSYKGKYRLVSGEDISVQNILSSSDFKRIFEFCEGLDLLVIDEAQNIKGIGQGLKIIVDNIKGIKVIATGSSSFELAGSVGEPLVGRQNIIKLYPVSQLELMSDHSTYELKEKLENYLRFGSYPEVLTISGESNKREYLTNIAGSYLYKDILSFYAIRNSDVLQKLVKKLAFYIGSEVSAGELSNSLGVDIKTVMKYLDLLEKSFVIFKLQGFSGNLAKEITKKQKYFFWDVGIRNAVINQFNKLEDRNDIGGLWENFVVVERIKTNHYIKNFYNSYFWRTYQGKEVDYIEEKDAKVYAYEVKWADTSKTTKGLKAFEKAYNPEFSKVINKDNYIELITAK